jgi:hypothetical protein
MLLPLRYSSILTTTLSPLEIRVDVRAVKRFQVSHFATQLTRSDPLKSYAFVHTCQPWRIRRHMSAYDGYSKAVIPCEEGKKKQRNEQEDRIKPCVPPSSSASIVSLSLSFYPRPPPSSSFANFPSSYEQEKCLTRPTRYSYKQN